MFFTRFPVLVRSYGLPQSTGGGDALANRHAPVSTTVLSFFSTAMSTFSLTDHVMFSIGRVNLKNLCMELATLDINSSSCMQLKCTHAFDIN